MENHIDILDQVMENSIFFQSESQGKAGNFFSTILYEPCIPWSPNKILYLGRVILVGWSVTRNIQKSFTFFYKNYLVGHF